MTASAGAPLTPPVRAIFAAREEGPWLFGRRTDLLLFGGSAALSLVAVAIGAALGLLHGDAPDWVWLSMIVGVDVAHVWSTSFRVYLPYLALTYRYGRARAAQAPESGVAAILRGGAAAFVAFVLIAAFLEEALWDRWIWHDRPWLFGGGGDELSVTALTFLVPLLALPQAVHYALDGFVWRVRKNPSLGAELTG